MLGQPGKVTDIPKIRSIGPQQAEKDAIKRV